MNGVNVVPLVIQIAALIYLCAKAFGWFPSVKVHYGWLGMALWLFSMMVGGWIVLHPVGH
jgi:hypothetical protein